MVSNGTEDGVCPDGGGPIRTTNVCKVNSKIPLHISTSQRGLLGQGNTQNGFLKFFSDKISFLKFDSSRRSNLSSPSAKFRRIVGDRDMASRSVLSTSASQGLRDRFREANWESMKKLCKEWIKNPLNMVLLVWIIVVAVSGAILFMVMVGMLDSAIPKKKDRNAWFEVNNQILNAMFTLMSLYKHPQLFHHLVLLCRWNTDDISRLRKIYCKHGTYKPHEWAHMMVVVVLLHLNCFATYALCGLNLGYKRSERPPIGVGICISVAFGAAAGAGVYTIMSPLGKEYESEGDEEAQDGVPIVDASSHLRAKSLEKRFSFSLRNEQQIVEVRPQWRGGLFDIWDNIYVAYLSLFCSFCVFGWNMDRLGLGNMYVHIATFLLFCLAPFWIFNLAAINIDNEAVREALGLTGVVLCIFGLLYGGFWRIQIRKRFNLPANNFCCGIPAVTDCCQWLFCCWCSLAQEVRTGDYYDIVENKLCIKRVNVPAPAPSPATELSPLPREGSPQWGNSSSPSNLTRFSKSPEGQLPKVVEEEESSSIRGDDIVLMPPIPPSIQREDDHRPPFTGDS